MTLQAKEKLSQIQTLDVLHEFVNELSPKIGEYGGRRYTYKKLRGSICYNDLLRKANVVFKKSLQNGKVDYQDIDKGKMILQSIENRRLKANEELAQNSSTLIKVMTAVKSFFGCLLFNRKDVLKSLSSLAFPLVFDLEKGVGIEGLSLAYYKENIDNLDPTGSVRRVYTYLAKTLAEMDLNKPQGNFFWSSFYFTCGFLHDASPLTVVGSPIFRFESGQKNLISQPVICIDGKHQMFDSKDLILEGLKPILEVMKNLNQEGIRLFLPIPLAPRFAVPHGVLMVVEAVKDDAAKITMIDPFGEKNFYRNLENACVQAAKNVFPSPKTTVVHNKVVQQSDGLTCGVNQIENVRVLLKVDNIQDYVGRGRLPKRSREENLQNFKSYIEFGKKFYEANGSVDIKNVTGIAVTVPDLEYIPKFEIYS